MQCSAYFGELSEKRKHNWNCADDNPYDVLKNPIETKSIEELVSEAMEYIIKQKEMSEEEEIEDDAEHGYFQNEEE